MLWGMDDGVDDPLYFFNNIKKGAILFKIAPTLKRVINYFNWNLLSNKSWEFLPIYRIKSPGSATNFKSLL